MKDERNEKTKKNYNLQTQKFMDRKLVLRTQC